ncbi:DUF6431 domain-containing protein [Paenibacillus cymbidii]|uniref:DUF6431 domain-containing protein n=1 Tax=Paenibacillus cymbidii TaxID=1639034 RepID=UPI002E260E66
MCGQVATPCCGGCLGAVGSRPRVCYVSSGEKRTLIIRRLYCKACERIHHELPDMLVPYKRYDAESIERAVSVPAWIDIAAGCLQAIAKRFELPVVEPSIRPQSARALLGPFVGDAAGWLKRAVRPIANSHLWVTDPFCLSVRPLSE